VNGGPISKTFLGNIRSNISKAIDSGYATTFDAHVIAGYRFIMRYYKEGDKIYMFGFSRGAFTARFLARMIHGLGLLSEGNEEMVPFAYDLYQQYEMGMLPDAEQEQSSSSNETGLMSRLARAFRSTEQADEAEEEPLYPSGAKPDEQQLKKNKLDAFKSTFCRSEGKDNTPIKVHFLGIFDCVSSVAVLDSPFGKAPKAVSVLGTAHYVRHAVAVDEHRVKFKAALLHQDMKHAEAEKENIKEVWFPGNHGDVGGGWPAPKRGKTQPKASWWRRIFRTWTDKRPSNRSSDPYQMSDIPLAWMIRELEKIGAKDPDSAIKWNHKKNGFKENFFHRIKEAYTSPMHDTLQFGGGASLFKVILWNFMEWLPFWRWELRRDKQTEPYKWTYTMWPFNMGGARDIPEGALLHDSLLKRLKNDPDYRPTNTRGDDKIRCLLHECELKKECDLMDKFRLKTKLEDKGVTKNETQDFDEPAGIHSIWKLKV
jgi:hypothetical protein